MQICLRTCAEARRNLRRERASDPAIEMASIDSTPQFEITPESMSSPPLMKEPALGSFRDFAPRRCPPHPRPERAQSNNGLTRRPLKDFR